MLSPSSCRCWVGSLVSAAGAGGPSPARVAVAECGCDCDKCRRFVRARGIIFKIARCGALHGSGLGRACWVVEGAFVWLHRFKRFRIRYEIRADLCLALLQLVCSVICLR